MILRNGIDSDKIHNDLSGHKTSLYQKRFKKDGGYFEFGRWCGNEFNIVYRLKYVTNVIVKNLQSKQYSTHLNSLIEIVIPYNDDRPKYEISSLLYSNYHKQTHCDYLERKPLEICLNKEDLDHRTNTSIHDENQQKRSCCNGCCKLLSFCCCCRGSVQIHDSTEFPTKYTQIINEEENGDITNTTAMVYHDIKSNVHHEHVTSIKKRRRYNDPFQVRDIKVEIEETFQAFNLLAFGEPLVRLIVDQISKNNGDAYWYLLGELLYALPYTVAINALTEQRSMEVLRYVEHQKLNDICERLVEGSLFRCSAALAISKFFDNLADIDAIEEEIWRGYARSHEHRAYDEINTMDTDDLLYLALNIPLTQHHGESVLHLALKEKRIEFLNNSRIHHIVHHMYQFGELKPSDKINMNRRSYNDLLKLVLVHPFRFYYSAQGYHWTSGTVFMGYLAFICYYVYWRPIDGANIESSTDIALEITLWTMNIGYILYEMTECASQGLIGYLNLDGKGQSNALDIVISLFWILLFIVRMIFIGMKWDSHSLQNIYVFIFGIQIVLLTVRSLALFSNSQYLGKLYRALKLMFIEIFKFLAIFVIFMIGFLFGLWLISAANSSDDYEAMSLWDAAIYVFQVFIGTGDLSGVADQTIGILFMVAATLFGALILTNLLIALMTSEYEHVQERAKAEVIYNQTALTVELSQNSRLLPAPLNIIVFICVIIIDICNFCLSMISPKLNIYSYFNHKLFVNLRNYNVWQCEFDDENENKETNLMKTRKQIFLWYFVDWWLPRIALHFIQYLAFIFCCGTLNTANDNNDNDTKNIWRVYHQTCYGCLDEANIVRGVTMAEYLSLYQNRKKHQVQLFDIHLLNELTSNTLFCNYCYKPFLRDNVNDELITPFVAMIDFVSSIIFIIIPIAWIPLILLFLILSIKEYIFGTELYQIKKQTNKCNVADFEREYYAYKL